MPPAATDADTDTEADRPPLLTPTQTAALLALTGSHDHEARRLPWRAGTDAYGVLVSEVMSQQTQAKRAGERWVAFMERFPTVAVLAEAAPAEVIAAWVGLGYNRRAVNLQRAAAAVVQRHDGRVPADLDALLDLPGIGPYTARAVLAFAFGWAVVPVDTNVSRVLSRLLGRPLDAPAAQSLADGLAAGAVGGGAGAAATLMDLGASMCRSRSPMCTACPLLAVCSWAGGPQADPATSSAHRPQQQGRFSGSARQARGRLVRVLTDGPLSHAEALAVAAEHGPALLDGLVADGLIERDGDVFALPGPAGKG